MGQVVTKVLGNSLSYVQESRIWGICMDALFEQNDCTGGLKLGLVTSI